MSTAYEAFARDFFAAVGAQPVERDGRLEVALDGELAVHFGTERLLLTFRAHDPQGELVAYGSRAFEAMQGYLATRGRYAAGRLSAVEAAIAPLALVNGEAIALEARPQPRRMYCVNFHATYISDERHEQLLSYCLDEHGRPWPEAERWLAEAAPPEPLERHGGVPEAVLATAERLALDAAETAALPIEEAVLGRLKRAAERLTAYYEEQIEEVSLKRRRGKSEDEALDELMTERRFLRRELERKLAEETSRHQLRVQVRRISQAVVEVPGYERRLALQTPAAHRQVAYWENHHLGVAEYPPCERCGTAGAEAGLCAEGHLACHTCLGRCATCGGDRCTSELTACHQCEALHCAGCRGMCATGHGVCRHHLATCACCGQVFCGGCTGSCSACGDGRRVAKAHGETCSVCEALVCEAHATRCSWCSGQLCGAHAVFCGGCGESVCASHMANCAHCELPYCQRCRDEGSSCRACAAVGQAPRARSEWLASVAHHHGYLHWTAIENERYRYLLGHGLLGDVLVVTDHAGEVVTTREIGFWKKLFRSW